MNWVQGHGASCSSADVHLCFCCLGNICIPKSLTRRRDPIPRHAQAWAASFANAISQTRRIIRDWSLCRGRMGWHKIRDSPGKGLVAQAFSHPTFPTFPGRLSGVGCCSWDDMQMVVCGSAHVLHAMAPTTWHRSSVVGLRDDIIFLPFLSLARQPGITPKITTSHEDRHVKLPRWKLSETKFPCLRPDIV